MLITAAQGFGRRITSTLFGSMLMGRQRRTRRADSRAPLNCDGDVSRSIERVEDRRLLSAVSFQAINLQDQFNAFGSGSLPPDTMGAVGPNHFVEVINSSVAIYNKTSGARLSHVSLTSFFTDAAEGVTPANGTFDPRILYDRASGHWFATAMERGTVSGKDNDIILAVSDTSDPTGDWDRFRIDVGIATGADAFFTDYSTLGTDENGVYFGMRMFQDTGNNGSTETSFAKIAATPKASLIAATPSLSTVTQWSNITDMYSSPQPAHNQDDIGPSTAAWFVSSSSSVFANINYKTLTWSGGTPTLSSTSVLSTAAIAAPINAPASGSTTNVNTGDQRLQMAVIRNNGLWTTRQIGLNSTGAASSADRTGIEWFQLSVTTTTPAVTQQGRIFDNAASSPKFYYYPSIMVSGQGHARIGFSGSNGSEFVGAYSSSRLATDTLGTMTAPVSVKAGEASYTRNDGIGRNRWGDYSYTSLDPNDDMTLWTLQEYAESGTNIWGTWVDSDLAPAPTLNNPSASATQGSTSVVVNLTGTGIYDPGAGFVNRLAVQLTGGAANGISNYTVTFTNATTASVTFDVAANASVGNRDIVLTNPDGQIVTVVNGFTVNVVGTLSVALDGSSNLVITDTDGTGKANNLTVSNDGSGNIVISDAAEPFASNGGISGAVLSNGNKTLTVPVASITGTKVIVNSALGNDVLNASLATSLGKILDFNGGTAGSDKLTLSGGSTTSQTFNFTNENDGSVVVAGTLAGTINYTGLEPISSSITAADVILNYSTVTEVITVTQDGTDATLTKVDSNVAGESVSFVNPSGSLQINGGNTGDDTVTVSGFGTSGGGFKAALTIDGGTGSDTVNLNTAVLLGSTTSTGNLSVTAEAINVAANISTDGDTTNNDAGSVLLTGTVNMASNVVIDTNAATTDNNITVTGSTNADSAASNRTLTLDAGTGTIQTGNIGATRNFGTITVTSAGSATFSSLQTRSGGVSIAATTITLNGNLQTNSLAAAGNVSLTGALTLGANVSFNTDSTTDGNVSFSSTINGARTLTVTAGNGTATFSDNVGATTALTDFDVTAATINLAGDVQTDGGTLTLAGNTVLTAGSVTIDTEVGNNSAPGTVTLSGGSVSATATNRDFTINTATSGAPNAGAVSLNTFNNGGGQFVRDLTVISTSGSGSAGDVTFNGDVTLSGNLPVTGKSLTTVANADLTTTGAGLITVTADDVALDATSTLVSASIVTFKPLTASRPINLGTETVGSLSLTDPELDRVTAGTLQIGDTNSGAINVSAVISPANYKTLAIGNSVTFASSGGFSSDVGPTSATFEKIAVTGTVAITAGAMLAAASSGGYVFNGTDSFTFLTNDAGDLITGTFTGPTLTNFLGSTLTAVISYTGGSGNDLVISGPTNAAPTAVILSPTSVSIAENASTASATVVSTISVTDDGQGTNVLSLSGTDAASFEIVGNALRLKAGVALDFETKPTYTVTVNVDDASVGGAPDASATFTLNLTNSSELTGIDVQKGQSQRSFVRYLDILFDVGGQDLLNLISGNRLQLTRYDLNGMNGVVQAQPVAPAASGSMIQLDFGIQGIGGNRGTNAGDGYYEIALDMDGNGSFESKKYFHRLFGDVTGNGIIDATDKSQVLAAQGGAYSAASDVNGDGVVNVADTTLVTRAFGRKLKGGLFRDD